MAEQRLHRGPREIARGAIFVAVGAAVALGGYLLATSGGAGRFAIGGLVVLIGGFAIVIGLNGMFFEKVAACPSCDTKLPASARSGALSHCLRCPAFFETRDRTISLLPEHFVADEPRFLVCIPSKTIASFRMPSPCCLCGEPATRMEEQSVHDSKTLENVVASAIGTAIGAAAGIGVVRSGGATDYLVRIPHCARCTDGATARVALGGLDLRFRSLAFARLASEHNQLKLTL